MPLDYSSRKRRKVEEDPDVVDMSEDDLGDYVDQNEQSGTGRRGKRDRGGNNGLQCFTKLVCDKLEAEGMMTNTDIAEILVKEHSTGDEKKNDNIRRRVYDALSVIYAVGLAEKNGKRYIWKGRPAVNSAIHSPTHTQAPSGVVIRVLDEKRSTLIRMIRRCTGLEFVRCQNRQRRVQDMPTKPILSKQTEESGGIVSASDEKIHKRKKPIIEIGEFKLPLLLLSTESSTRMLMEAGPHNNELFIKINKPFVLKSSDSILTELGYDEVSRLETADSNRLLCELIGLGIPKDIIEEALAIKISDIVYRDAIRTKNYRSSGMDSLNPSLPNEPGKENGISALLSTAEQMNTTHS